MRIPEVLDSIAKDGIGVLIVFVGHLKDNICALETILPVGVNLLLIIIDISMKNSNKLNKEYKRNRCMKNSNSVLNNSEM